MKPTYPLFTMKRERRLKLKSRQQTPMPAQKQDTKNEINQSKKISRNLKLNSMICRILDRSSNISYEDLTDQRNSISQISNMNKPSENKSLGWAFSPILERQRQRLFPSKKCIKINKETKREKCKMKNPVFSFQIIKLNRQMKQMNITFEKLQSEFKQEIKDVQQRLRAIEIIQHPAGGSGVYSKQFLDYFYRRGRVRIQLQEEDEFSRIHSLDTSPSITSPNFF